MTTTVKLGEWRGALDTSRELMLKTIAGGEIVLTHATGTRMVAAWTLAPAPQDPVLISRRPIPGPVSIWPGSRHTTQPAKSRRS